jgi:hypothetical protein
MAVSPRGRQIRTISVLGETMHAFGLSVTCEKCGAIWTSEVQMTPLDYLTLAESALMTDQSTAAWAAIDNIRKARALIRKPSSS